MELFSYHWLSLHRPRIHRSLFTETDFLNIMIRIGQNGEEGRRPSAAEEGGRGGGDWWGLLRLMCPPLWGVVA